MRRAVHRYQIDFRNLETTQVVDMPPMAEVLHVDYQSGREQVSLWALVDPGATETEPRTFAVFGTGVELSLGLPVVHHVGSCMVGGFLMFHVFEVFRDA